jgi:hypothetical protein
MCMYVCVCTFEQSAIFPEKMKLFCVKTLSHLLLQYFLLLAYLAMLLASMLASQGVTQPTYHVRIPPLCLGRTGLPHFVERHFVEQHFVERHFVERHFIDLQFVEFWKNDSSSNPSLSNFYNIELQFVELLQHWTPVHQPEAIRNK